MNILSTQYTLRYKSFEIYVAGCNARPKCSGCHSMESWDFSLGEKYNKKYFEKISKKIKMFDNLIDKIFIMGGEPLDQNKKELIKFLIDIKNLNKSLWLFTRYDLKNISKDILVFFDYTKCGRYMKENIVENNIFYEIKLATSNQIIYKKKVDYLYKLK